MRKRFVLIDSALDGLGGHYFDYALRTLDAAAAAGYETFLVTRRAIAPVAMGTHGVLQVISEDFWRNFVAVAGDVTPLSLEVLGGAARMRENLKLGFAGPGYARSLIRRLILAGFVPISLISAVARRATTAPMRKMSLVFASDLGRLADELSGWAVDDLVFMPSLFVVETDGLAEFLDLCPAARRVRWRLLFRRDLDVEQRSTARVLRLRRRRLTKALQKVARWKCAQFFTDTEQLSNSYSSMSAIPFATGPIPLNGPSPARERSDPPLNIVFLGGANVEKGFHRLPKIAEICAPSDRLQYTFQANYSTPLGEPDCVAARLTLSRLFGVRLVDGPLSTREYDHLLSSADIILLPYDPVAYRARSSGVFTEALASGTPVIVTAGTWMASNIQVIEQAWLASLWSSVNANVASEQLLLRCQLKGSVIGYVSLVGRTASGDRVGPMTRDAAPDLRFLAPAMLNGREIRYHLIGANGEVLEADIQTRAVPEKTPFSAVGLIAAAEPHAIAEALNHMLDFYDHFASTARDHTANWCRTHSAHALVALLERPTAMI